eukprot:15546159-Heterocapsa_arctica.AAC.1
MCIRDRRQQCPARHPPLQGILALPTGPPSWQPLPQGTRSRRPPMPPSRRHLFPGVSRMPGTSGLETLSPSGRTTRGNSTTQGSSTRPAPTRKGRPGAPGASLGTTTSRTTTSSSRTSTSRGTRTNGTTTGTPTATAYDVHGNDGNYGAVGNYNDIRIAAAKAKRDSQ